MYDHILLPTDGSDHSTAAARQALGLAETFDATVHGLYVVDTGTNWLTVSKLDVEESLREVSEVAGDRALTAFEDLAAGYDAPTRTEVREGSVDEAILGYAADHDVDLVVMGTHGRDSVARRVVGSVAERVVRGATVPVMTVSASATE
ncbi:universal stress protein [Halorubrum sp. PV6]|uniref:universal stress protein n=1 Tax=Halorubrum sp. PV6 TaxID=634157 RepID=UPI000F85AF4F|nr:universal stress protein [Halorubrum sp. PV6]AZQ14584.1 universal stress protein [Halorubrum sp. PV6]